MDMRVSGKGKIPPGEYNKITLRGSGTLHGKVLCAALRASGSTKGEEIECTERFKASGRVRFSGDIISPQIRVAGSLSCNGSLIAKDRLSCHGSAKCAKSIKCTHLSHSGTLLVGADIEAESVRISGSLHCEGLLNAGSTYLQADKTMHVESIGGSSIHIKRKRFSVIPKRRVIVSSAIEGDELTLEYVTCPRVTGRRVLIGKGCKIDLVQYSDSLELSPKAKCGKTEKI